MIHAEDVTKNALSSHQPLTPEKIAFAIAMYDAIAENDPTGCLPVWIEQALDLCGNKYHIEFVEKQIDEVCEAIKNDYRDNSEVGMAEMLIGYKFPTEMNGYYISNYVIMSAIEEIIEWYDIFWTYAAKKVNDNWELFEIFPIRFNGGIYPTRTFVVEHDDVDRQCVYKIGTESLKDAIETSSKKVYTLGTENQIYFYVPDEVIYEDADWICRTQLDIPMKLIEEKF